MLTVTRFSPFTTVEADRSAQGRANADVLPNAVSPRSGPRIIKSPRFLADPVSAPTFVERAKQWFQNLYARVMGWISPEKRLFFRYGIDPETITVHTSPGITLDTKEKALILAKALEAHELALKNKILGNFSDDYRATSLQLENGTWEKATNFELFLSEYSLCGERSAIVSAWNKALRQFNLNRLRDLPEDQLQKVRNGLRVKRLIVTSSSMEDFIQVCSECENWMTSKKYFSPDTQIIALQPEGEGKFSLNIHTLGQRFPLHWQQKASIQYDIRNPLASLPVRFSDRASAVLAQKPFLKPLIPAILEQAKQKYLSNHTADFNGRNSAAAVAFTNGQVFTAARFEWKRRWYQPPDLTAASTGYQAVYNRQHPYQNRIEAVAYYGEDDTAPMVYNLGRLAQGRRGGPDTLIAVVQNDTIQVRTIADYIPMTYISQSYKRMQPQSA